MSDDVPGHLPYHEIDIPARFVQQAMEHIEHTKLRYVTFIFTGEMTQDAVCAGVTTRLMIVDQRPKAPALSDRKAKWTLETLNDAAVLEVLRSHGPLSTREINEKLNIPFSEVPLRQKVWRVAIKLHGLGVVGVSGSNRSRKFSVIRPPGEARGEARMPIRAPVQKPRGKITEATVLEQLRAGRNSSKEISDALGLHAKKRGTVTTHIRNLISKKQIIRTGERKYGGPVYKLVDASEMAG